MLFSCAECYLSANPYELSIAYGEGINKNYFSIGFGCRGGSFLIYSANGVGFGRRPARRSRAEKRGGG